MILSRYKWLGALGGLCLLASTGLAQQTWLDPQSTSQIEDVIVGEMAEQQITSVAVGVIKDGKLGFLSGYGISNIGLNVPASECVQYRWGDLSGILTTLAALKLSEQGSLNLDATVVSYLPNFGTISTTMTVRQLIEHTSGLNDKVRYNTATRDIYRENNSEFNGSQVTGFFAYESLDFPEGTDHNYSAFGLVTLGAVIESVYGSYEACIINEINIPLGLTEVTPEYPGRRPYTNQAVGQFYADSILVSRALDDLKWLTPAEGMLGSAADLTMLIRGVLNQGLLTDQANIDYFLSELSIGGTTTGWGLGVEVQEGPDGERMIYHESKEYQATNVIYFSPDSKDGVFLLSNLEMIDLTPLSKEIYEIVKSADYTGEEEDPIVANLVLRNGTYSTNTTKEALMTIVLENVSTSSGAEVTFKAGEEITFTGECIIGDAEVNAFIGTVDPNANIVLPPCIRSYAGASAEDDDVIIIDTRNVNKGAYHISGTVKEGIPLPSVNSGLNNSEFVVPVEMPGSGFTNELIMKVYGSDKAGVHELFMKIEYGINGNIAGVKVLMDGEYIPLHTDYYQVYENRVTFRNEPMFFTPKPNSLSVKRLAGVEYLRTDPETGEQFEVELPDELANYTTKELRIARLNAGAPPVLVRSLTNTVTWDGMDEAGVAVAAGVYEFTVKLGKSGGTAKEFKGQFIVR